jgi:hypothetical protein
MAQELERRPSLPIGEVTSVADYGTIVVLWVTSAEGQTVPVYFDHRPFRWLLDAERCTAGELVGRHATYHGDTIRFVD